MPPQLDPAGGEDAVVGALLAGLVGDRDEPGW